jgi:hypothetical protein
MSDDPEGTHRRPDGPDGGDDAATPPSGLPTGGGTPASDASEAPTSRTGQPWWNADAQDAAEGSTARHATPGDETGADAGGTDGEPRRGQVRYQDPETTTPREPTLAEQRARRESERRRTAQEEAAAAADQRKAKTRKRVLIGGGVAVGIVAIVAIAYAASSGGDEVNAQCTDQNGVVVDDSNCGGNPTNGSYGGGFVPIFLGGFGNQYHYNYGSSSPVGTVARGGSVTAPPSGTSIRSGTTGSSLGSTSSNGTVSRGGLGVSGSSSGSGSKGSSSGSGSSGS